MHPFNSFRLHVVKACQYCTPDQNLSVVHSLSQLLTLFPTVTDNVCVSLSASCTQRTKLLKLNGVDRLTAKDDAWG